ncbi:putative UDP-glucuronosyl/UDP-glucosyltransferase, UDP-glycosyltransferase family [Helianthus annuus]|uniref:Glycosyltransferase n=1 Tax=Helianthus annuus TaxID=4232 RepID=A0A251TKZ4_HELAN|nr:UDP-glycosyltransferase 84B1 [Helianthus annuus]KAF5786903.1 putative UDP-glucuronosyl/UDP-glucosyltransferase, UDP-glycosyltransferase family [Helianthus annuus]KAJ0522341.1 putative UDP-glucuronosyl/UDP-glucosyltransferase, UDP-glycosyltransferase family [Helianthus annuus]KAJ0530364.1 putative UDP-glucuronosyl/UDP-glucosyltransferase, UDP-glycosyltransferase family [Helianthus annuus]KAJ0697225.1 putative UDP-glucuronosyl/UDP-glucosyltransferase, UDP-glycosyltransferase family [Helianthus
MSSCCEQNTNVLLVTLSAQGHLNPILRLGKSLVSKGLHVTLATNSSTLKNMSSAPNSTGGIHHEFFSDGLPIDYNRKANMDHYMDTLSKFGPVNLLALIQSHPSKFACIIHTPFVPWVSDVAADVNLPNAMLWIQPSTLYQIYHRFYNRLDDFPTESNPDMSVKLPGLPVFHADELPSFVLPSNTFRSFDSILKQVFHNMHKVKWVLGNSFMELEKDVIVSLNNGGHVFWPVGPLVPATLLGKEEDDDLFKSNEDSNCMEWLNKQKPSSVVYISFGTLLFLSEKDIKNIAAGLKSTNRPFLWVIRMPENKELPEYGFLDEIKEQGLIVSWSPQTQVLSHPAVGCFLSHCGWNSLLESVVAGVPVIACPQWTDQPTNAKLVTDVWGVGVKLKKDSDGGFSGDEVGRCVEEVMSGLKSEVIRKNALELKAAAREALMNGGSSDNNIRMFVDEVVSFCSCAEHK